MAIYCSAGAGALQTFPQGCPECRALQRSSALLYWVLAASVTAARAPPDLGGNFVWKPLEWKWYSQYGQDRFIFERFFAADVAAAAGGGPRVDGVFVELGAADGVEKSNTLGFESNLGWTGLLIEPSTELFARLPQNRPRSMCLHECVARTEGYYEFAEDGLNSAFSMHRVGTQSKPFDGGGVTRFCRTLPDLLDEHLGNRTHIHYLSLDLEGGELDILESLDFTRYTIDVISVEVHDWREHERASRMAKLLYRRGFHFVERLVYDEIWVRDRGRSRTLDPSCLQPGLSVLRPFLDPRGPRYGWARMRDALRWLHGELAPLASMPDRKDLMLNPPAPHNASLQDVMDIYSHPDPAALEGLCPIGALAAALAVSLVTNRQTLQAMDTAGVSSELRHQTVFHPTTRLVPMTKSYDYQNAVTASEREGAKFEVRFPLGRAWHETSFLQALESGWPLFGLLDIASRLTTSVGHLYEKITMNGNVYNFPLRIPRPTCALEPVSAKDVLQDGPRLVIMPKPRGRPRSPRTAIADIALDVDACGLLGIAVARFHAARAEVQRHTLSSSQEHYVPLVNWTISGHCRGLRPGPAGPGACSTLPHQECAALDSRGRQVPRPCLRLRRQLGTSMRLRRWRALSATRAGLLIEEGERLLREFVQKHGLFIALFTLASPEFAPQPVGASAGFKRWDGVSLGETAFAVLHTVQQMLLSREGLTSGHAAPTI